MQKAGRVPVGYAARLFKFGAKRRELADGQRDLVAEFAVLRDERLDHGRGDGVVLNDELLDFLHELPGLRALLAAHRLQDGAAPDAREDGGATTERPVGLGVNRFNLVG